MKQHSNLYDYIISETERQTISGVKSALNTLSFAYIKGGNFADTELSETLALLADNLNQVLNETAPNP